MYGEVRAFNSLVRSIAGAFVGNNVDKSASDFFSFFIKDVLKYGLAEYKDGKLVASDAEKFIKGWELAKGSRMERLFIGGARADVAFNPLTGEALTNVDSSQFYKNGRQLRSQLADGVAEFIDGAKELGGLLTMGGVGTWVGKKIMDKLSPHFPNKVNNPVKNSSHNTNNHTKSYTSKNASHGQILSKNTSGGLYNSSHKPSIFDKTKDIINETTEKVKSFATESLEVAKDSGKKALKVASKAAPAAGVAEIVLIRYNCIV